MTVIPRAGSAASARPGRGPSDPAYPHLIRSQPLQTWSCTPVCDKLYALKSLRGRCFSDEPLSVQESSPGWSTR